MKKTIIIFLCVAFAASVLTACSSDASGNETETQPKTVHAIPKDDTSFKLCYTQSDSLNPYKCETQTIRYFHSLFLKAYSVLMTAIKQTATLPKNTNTRIQLL